MENSKIGPEIWGFSKTLLRRAEKKTPPGKEEGGPFGGGSRLKRGEPFFPKKFLGGAQKKGRFSLGKGERGWPRGHIFTLGGRKATLPPGGGGDTSRLFGGRGQNKRGAPWKTDPPPAKGIGSPPTGVALEEGSHQRGKGVLLQ